MFDLRKQAAKLVHINVREEKHGDDPVPAVDLKITADLPNTFLAQLHPTLRWSLYDKAATEDALDKDHMPVLRYTKMEPIHWKGEAKGGFFTVHAPGDNAAKDLRFAATVNMLQLDCHEGGTVIITFRVQSSDVGAFVIGSLAGMLGQDVVVSVEPPEPVDESAGQRKARTRARRGKTAGDPDPQAPLLQ